MAPPETSLPDVSRLGDCFIIDTRHGGYPGIIGVFLLPGPSGTFSLVEAGPGTTLSRVIAGIRQAGFELQGLSHILLTHIHLDHAGAAGELARRTGATVVVHGRGARHLVDPTRLLASAKRIYQDRFHDLWGDMTPLPQRQLKVVEGGDRFSLGRRGVQVLYTPGHASHQVAFLLEDGTLFTGDAAAIRLPGATVVRPALPPPETDLELWEASLALMERAKPSRLMLTHFGEVREVTVHLQQVREQNRLWAEEILTGLRLGESSAELEARIETLTREDLMVEGAPAEVRERYQVTSSAAMTVMGLTRYWRKHHPELLGSS